MLVFCYPNIYLPISFVYFESNIFYDSYYIANRTIIIFKAHIYNTSLIAFTVKLGIHFEMLLTTFFFQIV